jgi:hypothetical protein
VIALDYDWQDSFDYLVEEEAYISAFFHLAHREMKSLAKSLEDMPREDEKFEPDTSWAEELLEKDREEVTHETFYEAMSYTPESERRRADSLPEARVSAEVKYLWENLAHDLDFYSGENYEKLFSQDLVTHLKEEIVENHSELI